MGAPQYIGYATGGWSAASTSITLSANKHRAIIALASWFAIGIPSAPTAVTVGGSSATKICEEVSVDTEVGAAGNMWIFLVPSDWSGSKTVQQSGGSGSAEVIYAIEVAPCKGYKQSITTDGNDANLTLNSVLANSLCLDWLMCDNPGAPSPDEGNTTIHASYHDDADNRLDCGWGTSYEAPPGGGGNVTMGWNQTTSNRAYLMAELKGYAPGSQTIWFFERLKDFYGDLKRGQVPPDQLLERYGKLLPI